MAYPAITPSPPAPQRTQAGDAYAATADTWAAWLESAPDQINIALDWIEDTAASLVSSGLSATSSASLTIGTGSKSFAASPGAAFVGGQSVVIANSADPTKSMTGTVTAYNSGTGNITVNVTSVSGSGTFASWTIGLALVADLSGYLQKAGGTLTGLLTLAAAMGLVLTPGSAPGSPVDGQIWRETNKLMARIGAVNFEVVLATLAQTLTNKTLTSPTINGGTVDTATVNAPTINGYTEGYDAPSSGTAFSPNLAADTLFYYQTSGNVTITLPSPVTGKSFTIALKYGGAHTLTWAGGARLWPDGTAPTPTSVSGKFDVFTFFCFDGTNWLAFASGQNS
jgi:hypothetical protein